MKFLDRLLGRTKPAAPGRVVIRAGLIEGVESAVEFGHPVEIIPFAPPGME